MTREEVQYQAIKAWVENDKAGTIVIATGGGKTYVGSTIATRQLLSGKIKSVLIVVPTIPLIDQWRKVLNLFSEGIADTVDILCLKSAYKLEKDYDLLIVDEIHTSLSPEYRKLFENIRSSQVLGLTATIPTKYRDVLDRVAKVVYTKDLDEMQEEGNIIAPYRMYNLKVALNKRDKARYKVFDEQFKKSQIELGILKKKHSQILGELTVFDIAKTFSGIKDVQAYLEEMKDYENSNKYSYFSQDLPTLIKSAKRYWSAMTMRKWVCYESESKLKTVQEILLKFPDKKWIVFNKSIKFAERIKEIFPNSLIYHSKMKEKERTQTLAEYRKSENNLLIAVDALNAGLDVPEAEAALSVSGVSTELIGVQQLGRIIRFVEGKTALFINLSSTDTVEENWTKSRTEKFKDCIWINTTNQILS